VSYLAAKLVERGWQKGQIGVEWTFSAKACHTLDEGVPATLVDATALVNRERGLKSLAGLALIRKAARIVARMHVRTDEEVARGMRKCDLVPDIYHASLGFGWDYPAIVPLLPSGTDAAALHLTWDDRPMQSGEWTFSRSPAVFAAITAR
jgi:ectoine hydrolase